MSKRVSQQIGWSQESKLYYYVLKQLEQLTGIYGKNIPITTTTSSTSSTTTTTTTLPSVPSLKVNPDVPTRFDIDSAPSGNGNFTIEWLQYMHTDTNFSRIYSIGQYPAQNAVSIEGDTLYLWLNGAIQGSAYLPDYIDPYLDTWVHIVVTRKASDLAVWANGIKIIGYITFEESILTDNADFYIGSENADNTYYNGLISNFRWTTGLAVYGTDSPTYPIAQLEVLPETILLIGQGIDLSQQLTDWSEINTITASGITYNSDSGINGYDGSLQFGTI